jgi:hypothetical protein
MYKKGKGRKGVKARQQQDNGQYQEMLTPRNVSCSCILNLINRIWNK